jgi:tRNA nucleotidyltransferase (CCA-adding enzyme)
MVGCITPTAGSKRSMKWGDYSGYQYNYSERGSFYRQWWLANDRTIIFIVFDSNTELEEIEIDEIDKIVNSITVIKP